MVRYVSALTVAGFVMWSIACHSPTQQTSSQTGQTVQSTTQPHLLIKITISGPSTVAPGQGVSFAAQGTFTDGTTDDETQKVTWHSSNSNVLSISSGTGQAVGIAVGDTTVTASGPHSASASVTVVPPGTFRLSGTVLELQLPVTGATVKLTGGVGAGLSTITDYYGTYRLYGVAGQVTVSVTKAGYVDLVKTTTVTQNAALDFPDAQQVSVVGFAGTYTLTLTADPACPTQGTFNIPPLPDEARQPRVYTATITQNGPALSAVLSGAVFAGSSAFTGRVEPDDVVFQIGDSYYYTTGIEERLPSGTLFNFIGTAVFGRSDLNGKFNGKFDLLGAGNVVLGECLSSNHKFSLTPLVSSARRRR
jgi:hypothetical protein